ncbi:MAG: membrane dipeptidase [Sphingobacteriaceae bacterium]|nr:membrane dipeptidase [Cytophagaceae bacterium]
MPLLIDAHLDLALNALEWNRDLSSPVAQLREAERGMSDKIDRGRGTVSLPELRRGGVGLVVATQIARFNETPNQFPGAGFNSPAQAWAVTQAQRAWYEAMVDLGEMTQITDLDSLENHLSHWRDERVSGEKKPIGYILSLEGADSLIDLSYLEKAHGYGLRAIGPAHYGPGRYASGTGLSGPLTPAGRDLLREMDRLGMILDVTHLTDEGFDEALDLFKGPIWASHHNCRALVPHQRQLSDEQILRLAERGAVIGGCLDAWMLTPGFTQRKSNPVDFGVTLATLIDHFDHICQLTGNARHIAIGSDLDGTFGTEQSPTDLDTIADLQNLSGLLEKRGYSPEDVEGIFSGNWLRFLRKAWS